MSRLLLVVFAALSTLTATAQYNWEYGIMFGGANYLGDIGGQELTRRDFVWDMHLNKTNIGRLRALQVLEAFGGYGQPLLLANRYF